MSARISLFAAILTTATLTVVSATFLTMHANSPANFFGVLTGASAVWTAFAYRRVLAEGAPSVPSEWRGSDTIPAWAAACILAGMEPRRPLPSTAEKELARLTTEVREKRIRRRADTIGGAVNSAYDEIEGRNIALDAPLDRSDVERFFQRQGRLLQLRRATGVG